MTVRDKKQNEEVRGGIITVKIDGGKLHKAVSDSPFTFRQVCTYIGKNGTTLNDAKRRNAINKRDLEMICGLIGEKAENFYVKSETPKTSKAPKAPELKAEKSPKIEEPKHEYMLRTESPKTSPMTAREDPAQNWLVNIYRAIEDQTDRVDIQVSKASDNIAAIRGLREAIIQQTEMLREIREMLR